MYDIETRERIKQRTIEALQNPKVKSSEIQFGLYLFVF